jgi:hypothetical protein
MNKCLPEIGGLKNRFKIIISGDEPGNYITF